MQKAKAAVSDLLHKDKHHTVDIDQEEAPAVVHERIAQKQHEEVTTAVDREVHQHHHQTHVQPIQDQVVEGEQHHHNIVPIEERHQHHGKDEKVKGLLAEEQNRFGNEREVLPATGTSSANEVVGEHVHHHVHDIIQPVVERDVLKSDVVHTTVPIHESIEKEPVIHKGNVLPTVTMDEFSRGGTHSGNKHEHIDYEGEPLDIGNNTGLGRNVRRGDGDNWWIKMIIPVLQ